MTIQHSITTARQKELRSGVNVNHGHSNEFLDSDRTANVYFTSDVDDKNSIRSLNEFPKINLNGIRRTRISISSANQFYIYIILYKYYYY